MEKVLKIIIALVALLCLLPMSQDVFEFSRFILIVLFGIVAYSEHLNANIKQFGFYVAMIFVFQPFVPLPLGELGWSIAHIALAVLVLGSLSLNRKVNVESVQE